MKIPVRALVSLVFLALLLPFKSSAVPKKHSVLLGRARKVAYSQAGDPAGAAPGEASLSIRALLVDGTVKEWTTGEIHDVTERSFVVRRALRVNNSLPGDKAEQWVWQRGPWLLVDRATRRVTPLKLPDYSPAISQVVWFRDYAAYCGITPSGKSLYAVVAQLGARRPVLSKKLSAFDAGDHPVPACAAPRWQRDPMRLTFRPAGKNAVAFDFVAGAAVLVDGSGQGRGETPAPVRH